MENIEIIVPVLLPTKKKLQKESGTYRAIKKTATRRKMYEAFKDAPIKGGPVEFIKISIGGIQSPDLYEIDWIIKYLRSLGIVTNITEITIKSRNDIKSVIIEFPHSYGAEENNKKND